MLLNTRLLAIFILGLASGLPLALTGSTLQAWFTTAHINLVSIGTLTLLGLPYALKFLWAPLLDHYTIPILGKRKGWLLITQACLILTIFALSLFNPQQHVSVMGLLAFLIAFFSATQDIAISAYQTDLLTTDERGLGAAYLVFAYRLAGLISGGVALILAERIGWSSTYQLMAGFIFLIMLYTIVSPNPRQQDYPHTRIWQTISMALSDILQREHILLILAFIMLYKFGDALALTLMTNFLLHGLNFSLTQIGFAYKTVGFIAVILGGFVGGVFLTRWSVYSALLVFGVAQAFSNLLFAGLSLVGHHLFFMTSAIAIESFCSGLSTAALLAFMMSLCDHRYSASQFALFSALASIGRIFLGPGAAFLVEHLGWTQFFIITWLVCFPSIMILFSLKHKVLEYAGSTSH